MGIWYLVILIAAFLIGIPVAISMGGSAAILMILERGARRLPPRGHRAEIGLRAQ